MKTASLDMTKGSINKQILIFTLPLILSNIIQVLFNMADVAVVGRFAGAKALGSVGSTVTLVVLFTGFLIGLGGGVNALTALFIGAKSDKDVEETIHTSILVCLFFGLIIMISCFLLAGVFLNLLNTKDELLDGALLYLRIYFCGMPALALFNFGNGVFSALGDTKKPLYYLSFSGALNVILNLIFVIVFNLGVAGVAIASVIAQYVSAVLVLNALMKRTDICRLSLSKIRFNREKAVRLCGLGVPAGLQNAIFQLANLFIQAGVNSFDAVVVEGNSAAANADGLVYTTMASFYTACTSFVSQNLGAKNKERIKKSLLVAMFDAFFIGAFWGILLLLFGRYFLYIFSTDAAVVDAGLKRLTVMAFSYCISAFMDCPIAASRGLGKTGMPTFIVIMGSCVFRIIWVYTIFRYFHTMESLYLLYVFSWTLTAVFELTYFAREYKNTLREI